MGVNTAIAKEGKMAEKIAGRRSSRQVPKRQHQDVEPCQRVAGAYPFRDLNDHLKRGSTPTGRSVAIGGPI